MTERFEKINLPLKDALVLRRKLVSDSRVIWKDSTVRKSLVLLGGMMASNRSIEPLQKDLLEECIFKIPKEK